MTLSMLITLLYCSPYIVCAVCWVMDWRRSRRKTALPKSDFDASKECTPELERSLKERIARKLLVETQSTGNGQDGVGQLAGGGDLDSLRGFKPSAFERNAHQPNLSLRPPENSRVG